MTGAWTFIVVVGALWILAAGLAAWRLYRIGERRSRPIDEHTDAHYRRHNGASGGSFQ